jgi:hypothetical protein
MDYDASNPRTGATPSVPRGSCRAYSTLTDLAKDKSGNLGLKIIGSEWVDIVKYLALTEKQPRLYRLAEVGRGGQRWVGQSKA